MDSQLSKEQQQDYEERMQMAGAFEEMIHTRGWEYLSAYYQNQIRSFTNSVLVENKPIEDFRDKRSEIVGLRKVFSHVQGTLDFLAQERKKRESTGSASE